MKKIARKTDLAGVICLGAAVATSGYAAVSLTDREAVKKQQFAQRSGFRIGMHATGSRSLIDSGGLKYFINTNITFSTSSSASAAISEASYTHAVAADTLNGGVTMSALNDAFDGYNTICFSLNHTVASCETGNANFLIYNKTGAGPVADPACVAGDINRQLIFPTQLLGSLSVLRKVYIPNNDEFARWLNEVTNTGGSVQTVTLVTANNLGSDSQTTITASSTGSTGPTITATNVQWIASFQNFSGTTSSDPRLGHVFQGPGAATPLAALFFENGNDNPYWGYTFTLAPGQTKIIMDFVTGQPSRAAAAAQAARLVTLPTTATTCMSPTELAEVANFNAVPAGPAPSVPPGIPVPAIGLGALAALASALAVLGWMRGKRRRSPNATRHIASARS